MKNGKRVKDFDLIVCKNVRSIRKMLGLTQQSVAQQLNITSQQIHKYEEGKDRISINVLSQLANIFSCDIKDFLPRQEIDNKRNILKVAENNQISELNTDTNVDKQTLELINLFFSLKREKQAKLLKVVREFVEKEKSVK